MPAFTPKLEGLIREYGAFFDAQLKDMLNPRMNVPATVLRLSFCARTKGEPLRDKIHAETGWDVAADPEKHLLALVALAEMNGSTAGDQLKRLFPAFMRISGVLTALPRQTGLLKSLRTAKKLNLSY